VVPRKQFGCLLYSYYSQSAALLIIANTTETCWQLIIRDKMYVIYHMCICCSNDIRLRFNKTNIATSNGLMNMNIWTDIYIIFFCFEASRIGCRKIILLGVWKLSVGFGIQRKAKKHPVLKVGI
jgi:hypothetical protein